MNDENIKQSLRYVLKNGISSAAADAVSTGTILIAFAVMLGASNIYIGFILSLPYFANLMNFLAAYMLEKGYSCKKISIISSLISKPMYFIIALIAFMPDKHNILTYLFVCIFLLYFSGNITGGAFGVWMKKLVPQKVLGIFFARRYIYMMWASLFCHLGTYFVLKYFKKYYPSLEIYAYAVMFFIAFLCGLYTIYTFFFMKDEHSSPVKSEFYKNLKLGLKNSGFIKLSLYVGGLRFLINFFFPFVTVFLLKNLMYSMDLVIILTVVFQLAYIFSSNFWGKLSDELNIRVPIFLALLICIVCIFVLILLSILPAFNSKFLFLIILMLQIILGIVNSSFQLGLNNIPLLYINKKNANTLIPTINAVKSLFAGCGSVFAGMFLTYMLRVEKYFGILGQNGWTLFFMFALCLCVFLLFRVKNVKKYQNI